MKNHKFLILAALLFSFNAIAQEDNDEQPVNINTFNGKKHELRIDALEGLIIPAIDIGYEYVINRYSGVGASINVALSSDNDIELPQDFAITPYYRQYFFSREDYGGKGFFAEGLLQYATGEETFLAFNEIAGISTETNRDWSQFGIGFAVGQKWVSRNGFVVELSLGGGRYLGGEDFAPSGFFRGGASIGYRF